MKLPKTAHASRPWRIHEVAHGFRLEDVWALPTPGGPDDFPRLVQMMASSDTSQGPSRAARALWAIRWKIGELLGWDGPDAGHGSQRPTLRERLPADLRETPVPGFDALPFAPLLYLLGDEFAAEIANRTVHGVMHLGWVPDGTGRYCGQMAVLVKPNGPLGSAYMAAIGPFRHLIVYPAMMRQIGREWRKPTPERKRAPRENPAMTPPLRYVDPSRPRGRFYRAYAAFSGTRPGRLLSAKVAWKVDPYLLRATRGRVGTGLVLPTALLETRGAKSGAVRRNAVVYFHDSERVTIIASKAGAGKHPDWFHNLLAHPDDVVLGGVPVRATIIGDEAERERLWALADRVFAPFAAYRREAAKANRTIPIVQLAAREPDPGE